MSMIPFSSGFGGPFPFFVPSHALDMFFDKSLNLRLRDHVGKLEIGKDGSFTYKIDVSGFKQDELKVEADETHFYVTGNHKSENQHEKIERNFSRVVEIPAGIDKQMLSCDVDEKGVLTVSGQKSAKQASKNKRKAVPIELKGEEPPAKTARE